MKDFIKNHLFAIVYGTMLISFTIYALLDVFVIPRPAALANSVSSDTSMLATNLSVDGIMESHSSDVADDTNLNHTATDSEQSISDNKEDEEEHSVSDDTVSENQSISIDELLTNSSVSADALAADASVFLEIGRYADENIGIVLNRYYYCGTYVYVADIYLTSPAYFKTAFANDTYGRNITKPTTKIAADHGAILAINGDYYGARQSGYVLRNGVLFGDVKNPENQDLAIKNDGSFLIYNEADCEASDVVEAGVWQAWSFGPALIMDSQISVGEKQEVAHAMYSNPRTAIGEVNPGHYYFIVSDGRTDESKGLSLYQLAEFMQNLGCKTAYNLDGGGSSTMYFQGQLINKPSPGNGIIAERSVSDIVYIGY